MFGAALTLAVAALLAGCADKEPTAPTATPVPAGTSAPGAPSIASPTATSTALPGMPVPMSVGDSPIDSTRLRSLDDLPSAFGCPAAVTPIRIPAPSPNPTVTILPAPEALVCASSVAGKEAIYLWYCSTPEAKLGALTVALAQTKYVHAGPNWVAAGMVNPTLGAVGGEVYR